MTSVSTPTSIANDALAELGSTERLTSIDDQTSKSARRAAQLWPGILRELLELHPWNFAIGFRLLNVAVADVPPSWRNAFALPEDCVRWLPPGEHDRHWYRGERVGAMLFADHDGPLPCRYIRLVDDPSLWRPSFVTAFMLRLAMSMAEGVTQSEGIKDRLQNRYEGPNGRGGALAKAKRLDGLETGAQARAPIVVRSSWLSARRGYLPYRS